jgi:hypothetical protein
METATRYSPRFPALLVAVLVAQIAWLGWNWWYGAPRPTADSMCFKQPAYMRLWTPHFSIPTYAGHAVAIEKFNSYPAVVYYYLNYLVFRVFGFSLSTSLALDLLLHLALAFLGAWCVWKATDKQLCGAVFLIASMQTLLPIGRPEEMGALLGLLALLTVERGPGGRTAAIVLLGLSGVTSPGAAIVGTTLLVAYVGFRRNFDRSFWPRAAALVIVPPLISVGIYAWYTWPDMAEAIEQHRLLNEENVYYRLIFIELVRSNPYWIVSTVPLLLAATMAGIYCLRSKPAWFPRDTQSGALVAAATFAIPIGCALNIVARRVEYDYRHVTLLALGVLTLVIGWWPARAPARYGKGALAALALVLLISLPVQQLLVRYTLAPLAWEGDAMRYEEAARLVDEVIPPDATVGGDGRVWSLIDDGRPFIATQAAALDHWPDYLISGSWSRQPAVAQQTKFEEKLAAEYEEITPQPVRPHDGCRLRVAGLEIPLATGRCDWYVRIWKKKDAP